MFNNYKIICATPAGRRRYMQYLIPHILASPLVDRYDIWLNTLDKQDTEFFKILEKKYPKIKIIPQPAGIVDGNKSINAFFKNCTEPDTIYFRLDDDIVWAEPEIFEKMLKFRIDNPQYFIVSPLVINNALCTYILQNTGKIKLNTYYHSSCFDKTLWKSGKFAEQLHNWFLDTKLPDNQYKTLYSGAHPISMNRFNINAILWFGKTWQEFNGIVDGDEEEWISVIKPFELKACNCVNADAVVSHFAFYPQREVLDKTNILKRYGSHIQREWQKDTQLKEINKTVQEAMLYVETHKDEINKTPALYKAGAAAKKNIRNKISAIKIPVLNISLSDIYQSNKEKQITKYILE